MELNIEPDVEMKEKKSKAIKKIRAKKKERGLGVKRKTSSSGVSKSKKPRTTSAKSGFREDDIKAELGPDETLVGLGIKTKPEDPNMQVDDVTRKGPGESARNAVVFGGVKVREPASFPGFFKPARIHF